MPDKNGATIPMEKRFGHDDREPTTSESSRLSGRPGIQHANVANTLRSPEIRTVLDRLFVAAAHDDQTPRWPRRDLSWETATAQERADALESAYLPISVQCGNLLYLLVRAKRPDTVIEFGTSYGISTIHLAAAVADNGAGRVISTELSETKVLAARANLEEAHLMDRVTILLGDARTTLNDIAGPVDFVLLDGWKDLCLPVLRSLESRLSLGALIVADDINLPSLNGYLEYVRSRENGYVSVAFPVGDGMELSCSTVDRRFDGEGAL